MPRFTRPLIAGVAAMALLAGMSPAAADDAAPEAPVAAAPEGRGTSGRESTLPVPAQDVTDTDDEPAVDVQRGLRARAERHGDAHRHQAARGLVLRGRGPGCGPRRPAGGRRRPHHTTARLRGDQPRATGPVAVEPPDGRSPRCLGLEPGRQRHRRRHRHRDRRRAPRSRRTCPARDRPAPRRDPGPRAERAWHPRGQHHCRLPQRDRHGRRGTAGHDPPGLRARPGRLRRQQHRGARHHRRRRCRRAGHQPLPGGPGPGPGPGPGLCLRIRQGCGRGGRGWQQLPDRQPGAVPRGVAQRPGSRLRGPDREPLGLLQHRAAHRHRRPR